MILIDERVLGADGITDVGVRRMSHVAIYCADHHLDVLWTGIVDCLVTLVCLQIASWPLIRFTL